MIEAYGNIWDHVNDYDIVVITTNGFVKKSGEAVMGRGIALEAKTLFPQLPYKLGQRILKYGNLCFGFSINSIYGNDDTDILSSSEKYTGKQLYCFPVKPQMGPNGEPGWKARADIKLVEQSAKALRESVDYYNSRILGWEFMGGRKAKVIMPRPGCGNGGLKWEDDVKPIIAPILDDRFIVMEKGIL